jgi:hypothetical protein
MSHAPIDFYRKPSTTKPEYYSIKVSENNQTRHFKIPIFGDSSADTEEDLLLTAATMLRTANRLNWDDNACVDHFENCLAPHVAPRFLAICNGAPAGTTFTDNLHEFIQEYIRSDDAFIQLRDYIRRAHKTRDMSVRDYFNRIDTVCFLAQALPQAQGMDLLDD